MSNDEKVYDASNHLPIQLVLRIKIIRSGDVDLEIFIRRTSESEIFNHTKTKGDAKMKYLLLIYQEEKQWAGLSEAERQKIYAEYGQLRQELTKRGHFVGGSQLHPVSTATSMRVRDGKALATDGPFAETKEQLGGYFLIEAKNLDEALGIAARIPSAREGTVEVRPIVERTAEAAA